MEREKTKRKVTVVTQVYNTKEKYLRQSIESVLNQTVCDIEYILIDNGCTDSSTEIMQEYAYNDSRIILFRFDQNRLGARWIPIVLKKAHGVYLTNLDSDDWWEPDYLKRLISVADETTADIVCTGTRMHETATGRTFERTVQKQLLLKKDNFSDLFPYYHAFLRPIWGKLFRTDLFHKADVMKAEESGVKYGFDTILCFLLLRSAESMILDNSVLHNYRINTSSVSYQYDFRRFDSNIYLYNDAIDFLSAYGPISDNNNAFLFTVYVNAVEDTLKNLINADLTSEEKAREIYKILNRDVTKKALVFDRISTETLCKRIELGLAVGIKQTAEKLSAHLFGLFLKYCTDSTEIKQEYIDILRSYFVNCGKALNKEDLLLLANESEFRKLLIKDDRTGLISLLANLIRQKTLTKKYNLEDIITRLSSDDSILLSVSKSGFIRKYYDIYIYIVNKEYRTALENMTLILSGAKRVSDETFLWLYITLAALLEKTDEFLYGKLRMAEYHLCRKKYDECRAELNDLAEMGVEDNDEIKMIKKELETVGK